MVKSMKHYNVIDNVLLFMKGEIDINTLNELLGEEFEKAVYEELEEINNKKNGERQR